MAAHLTTDPTKKILAYRLAHIREKISALQQEEEKMNHQLAQELAKCLINAQALDIEFNTLLGGILEAIHFAHTNTTPERIRRMEAWKKSGQAFRRSRGQGSGFRGQSLPPAKAGEAGNRNQENSLKKVESRLANPAVVDGN